MTILEVSGPAWSTPLTRAAAAKVGDMRLRHTRYAKGDLYPHEGVDGFEYYEVVDGPMRVTQLQQRDSTRASRDGTWGRWSDWMVDDPLHWNGMAARVRQLPPGRVMCAGLGLGLMLHHLVRREDITEISVIERNPNVVKLIGPTLPEDRRIGVTIDDYYHHIASDIEPPDGILWDLAVGSPDEARADMITAAAVTKYFLPTSRLICFGLKDRDNWLSEKYA